MNEKVVKLGSSADTIKGLESLTETELAEVKALHSHPSTVGYIVFDADAEVIYSENVDDMSAPVFANVFDMCEGLGESLGQTGHRSTVFESKSMEITCRRFEDVRVVVVQGKGVRKAGS